MQPITPTRRKCLPALIATLVLLTLACDESGPPPDPTFTPISENIDAAIAEAVATALAEAAAEPTPIPDPGPDPTLTPISENIDAVIAEAVATALAEVVATVLAEPAAGPTPIPDPGPDPTPDPGSDSTPAFDNRAEATATATAKINADAVVLSEAVGLALDYYFNGLHRGDLERAIAYAVSITNADPDVVVRAMDEVLGSISGTPLPIDPAAKGMSNALAAAVTLALEYIIHSPNDREGAVAHAVSATGADAGAVAAAVDRVLANPGGFPILDPAITVAAANAVSQATALGAARARAEAEEAGNWATATAVAEQMAAYMATPTPSWRYDDWNDHEWLAEPKPWWRESNPYDCNPPTNPNSPWTAAEMPDLGGQDPLSLIRYFGNGSYVRYGLMGFDGCTGMGKYPTRTHLDIPVDPTYYSLGNLEIAVDIARVPADAPEWAYDDGSRVEMSMAEAVNVLNDNVAAYYRKISQGKLQMTFVAGEEFQASGRGTPQEVENQWFALIGIVGCGSNDTDRPGCRWGAPGALNRFFLNDVKSFSGGSAWNGYAELGLVTLKNAVMTTLVHEIGHGWMFWPHSYTELPWNPVADKPSQRPNFYSNPHDFMSQLSFAKPPGWYQDMPATLAINRYSAGWIEPEDVALHLSDEGTYRLAKPFQSGYQFLVIHSGRTGAFTTLEVLDERNAVYNDTNAVVYDPASPGQRRPIRYEGVMVSRYDQTTGTGINARAGPALYNTANPDQSSDVGYGRDDFSVIADGESRSIGGGLTVRVTKNSDGSYDVAVSGGRIAEYDPWCVPIWFSGEYDNFCMLEDFYFPGNN